MRIVETGFVHRVRGEKFGGAARGADGFHARLPASGVPAEDGDFCAGSAETIGERAPEDAGGADDDGYFIGKIKQGTAHVQTTPERTRAWQRESAGGKSGSPVDDAEAPVHPADMSTLAEIEAAIDALPPEQLREVLRHAQSRMSRVASQRYFYDDAHGRSGEADLVAEADAAFLAYDLDEERKR